MFVRMVRVTWRNGGIALVAAAVLCLGLAVAVSHAGPRDADLLKVRLGGDRATTRVVVDLDQAVSGKLIADGSADSRVVLMLPGVVADGQQGGSQGLVRQWMIDQTSGGARLQIDLASAGKVVRRFLLPPADGVDHYRYVVDIAGQAATEASFTREPVVRRVALRPTLPARTPPLSLKKVVVIDAGHGGHDPGAQGAQGPEKDVNLAAAKALKARLERSGRYKVVMIRDADVFVPLDSRVRIAQRADADLFISLHADSGPDPALRGASVYTLSDKASARSSQFVSKNDWYMKASLSGDRGVGDILLDLTQRATRNRSGAFAEALVARIDGAAPLLRRTHREAGLMVLLAPDVPAVLLEMGFVTNRQDEAFLRDSERRGRFMNAVGDAIDGYFDESTRLAAR